MMFRIQSFKQAVFWSTTINAFSQVLALAFSMVMAAVFGARESTDVLYYCIGVFALLSGLIQAANVSVLIPETMRRRMQTGERDAMAFINRFFAAFALIIIVLCGWILADPARSLTLISRFSAAALERNSRLVFWLLASLPLQMVAQLLLDVLVSYRFLALPAILSCVNRIINIIFVCLFHRQLGVVSVAVGMLLGFGLQALLNLYLLMRAVHWRPLVWNTRIGGGIYRSIAWTEIGTAASVLAGYLPLFLFSGFGAGAVTALNYAWRLSAMPTELLSTQLSSVIAVKFNELAANRQEEELASAFGRVARLLIFILLPIGTLLALTSFDIVSFLFARGAFGADAVRQTALLFALFVLNIPLAGLAMVMARYFVARQAIRYGTGWQIFSALLNAAMVWVWVRLLGPIGLPVGTIVHMLLYLAVLSISMSRRFTALALGPVWKSLMATSAACAAAALPGWLFRWRWGGRFSPELAGVVTVLLFAIGYGVLLVVFSPDRMAGQYCHDTVRSAWSRIRGAIYAQV